MRLDLGIAVAWVLVEGRLAQDGRRGYAQYAEAAGKSECHSASIAALPSGRVEAILSLPDAQAVASGTGLSLRPLGHVERILRMGYWVVRTWLRLSAEQRRCSDLSLIGAWRDLPGAYRVASEFRAMGYSNWLDSVEALIDGDRELIRAHLAGFEDPPQFHVVIAGDDTAGLAATRAALDAQVYPHFTVAGTATEADMDRGWLLMLWAGDRLEPHALYWWACEALARPEVAMIYADDDWLDDDGRRRRPRFKPDWSLAHLRATNYIGRAVAVRGSEILAAGGVGPDDGAAGNYDLLLRVAERAGDHVAHIPAVLLHQGAAAQGGDAFELKALRAHLARCEVGAEAMATIDGCHCVRFALPAQPPLVSIVIPTRDALALLRQCVESVLGKTTYPRMEIVVVDNGSSDPAALAYLSEIAARPGVRVLRWDRPFNFSAINNYAAREARGEVLCLLNNDTEVISPDWLDEMVGHLLQDKVGIVGAKLYYPDGRVQHGGDTVGPGGCANHLHAFLARDDPGYCNRAVVAQELSAVTAACMVTWRDLYLQLGGLNEKQLKVAFNDVDYCLRMRRAGYRVVWTPHAELYHHESVSRRKDKSLWRKVQAELEVRYMRRKWREEMKNDPFYNPNFSYFRPDFALNPAPRVRKPWL